MKIKMPTVNSNVKLITSNQAPTTSNLAKGEMAFGQVGGVNSIYGNTGNGIIKIEFTSGGEPIIYFANEEALNAFVEGDDVPASGWYAAVAEDSGDEPEPTIPYVQVSLSAMLSNGINSVKLSDYKETGTLASPQTIVLADDYTLRMDGFANRNTKFTINASIPFFGYPDHNFPSLQLNIYPFGYSPAGVVESNTEEVVEPRVQSSPNTWVINPVYEQGSKIVRWQGQTEKNLYELLGATTRDSYGKPLKLCIDVMQYQEGNTPTLSGTLKIEDA